MDDPGRLLDLLPDDDPLCWVRGGEGLVGWGEAARFSATGPDRFARADAWWRSFAERLDVRDEVDEPGSGPVAFASFTFAAESPGSALVVPRVVVGRRGDRTWVTEFTGDDRTPVRAVSPVRRTGTIRYADGRLPVSGYRRAVADAVRRMRAGELEKAALAHDLLAVADAPLDPRFLLGGLADRYPTCWAYSVDRLVGATPEMLVSRTGGRTVRSRVLAGTLWPDADGHPADAAALARRLLDSPKDRHEHQLAVDSLAAALRPLCGRLDVPDTPDVITLRNVSHLSSDVSGTLDAHAPASLLRLAEAVHPTAAVGGTPREAAVALIAELEGMDRGRYAGPVGWVDGDGDGELGIALRCAQLDGPVARLFAGCGVVADSDPDTEVREAAAKLAAVRDALEGVRGG
ncbi:isochorismate synthase [Pseudonocardia sp. S2-4]|uniref:isochorismate synthase n=1 Tax=Pseudonocardia humida TaxID=2800819 RepID=A0ABT1ADN1_9PSEU|nr:isochorismate synthase [Pseudonocardia humida]